MANLAFKKPVKDQENLVNLLVKKSTKSAKSILANFTWPENLTEDSQWIPDQLLTIYGTEYYDSLSEDQLNLLRKWESINFYSQNVHGERKLCQDLISRIYYSRFLKESEYIHFFLKEEADHMAVFAEFCNRYGKILESNRIDLGRRQEDEIEDLLLFSRTILFEYYVDTYNRIVGKSENVVPIARAINDYHHTEEARHILFSREMIKSHLNIVREKYGDQRVNDIARYLEDYMINQIELVYSTEVYRLAGIENPSELRIKLLQDPRRRKAHLDWIDLPYRFFKNIGLFTDRTKEEIADGYFKSQKEELKNNASNNPKQTISNWLIDQGNINSIDEDLDILESGIVDSLLFMRFLVVIEQATGKEMRLEEIDLDDIRTISNIERKFING